MTTQQRYTHGSPVTLTDHNGQQKHGTLHLPGTRTNTHTGNEDPLYTNGNHKLHTIHLHNGHRYRTEGKLTPQQ